VVIVASPAAPNHNRRGRSRQGWNDPGQAL
jgi:hypothetical protein